MNIFSYWVNECSALERKDIMHQIRALWNFFEDCEVKPEINLAPYTHKTQSGCQTVRPARVFYGGSQEQLMRKRQWFIFKKLSYALVCSLLRLSNIICFFNGIKIFEVIKNRKRLNKLNSVFENKCNLSIAWEFCSLYYKC